MEKGKIRFVEAELEVLKINVFWKPQKWYKCVQKFKLELKAPTVPID